MSGETPNTRADASSKRIIVVEDDDAVRTMIQMTLQGEGFQVKTARDGRTVVQMAQQFNPDLIISDVMMPGGGGYDLVRQLQADDVTRTTPVIIITGAKFDGSTQAMLSQEPNVKELIEKPLRPTGFVKKIHGILNTRSLQEKMDEMRKNQGGGSDTVDRFGSPF